MTKVELKKRRQIKIRKKIKGTKERPRISVYRSNKRFYAQAIDDSKGSTLVSISSKPGVKVDDIKKLGVEFAKLLKKKKLNQAVYDRSGYKYHGKVAAFAEGLRQEKIQI